MHGVKVMKVCGKDYCRACKSSNLFSALDLGNLPIANELVRNQSLSPDIFPLHLRICKECGLGQVEDVVSAERLFQDYRYLSSMSASFLDHANRFAKKTIEEVFNVDIINHSLYFYGNKKTPASKQEKA